MESFQIVPTTLADIECIYSLFESAIQYQQKKQYPVWNGLEREVIQNDIAKKRQYKIISGDDILCIFSVVSSDPHIWQERDKSDALYLHRIVVNPKHKGHRHFGKILNWSIDFAERQHRKFICMDTGASNPIIIAYYVSFGFTLLGTFMTTDSPEFSLQQRKVNLALLEYVLP